MSSLKAALSPAAWEQVVRIAVGDQSINDNVELKQRLLVYFDDKLPVHLGDVDEWLLSRIEEETGIYEAAK
jgi:hypothetical protein